MNECKHSLEHGEATVWPDEAELEHFDNCMTPERRMDAWKTRNAIIDRGMRCWNQDHHGQIIQLERRIQRGHDVLGPVPNREGIEGFI